MKYIKALAIIPATIVIHKKQKVTLFLSLTGLAIVEAFLLIISYK